MKRVERENVQHNSAIGEQVMGSGLARAGRTASRKVVALVMGLVLPLTATTAACGDRPPLHKEITVEGPSGPSPAVSRPKVGDGAPQTTVMAPSTGESPTTTVVPPEDKITKLVCRDVIFVSPGLTAVNPVVDDMAGSGKTGLFARDIRPVGEELIDEPPQDPGPKYLYVDTQGNKLSDTELRDSGHCQSIIVKVVMAQTVCPDGKRATYVPWDFDPTTTPLNRAPEQALNNPNYFHQDYFPEDAKRIPVPGGMPELTAFR